MDAIDSALAADLLNARTDYVNINMTNDVRPYIREGYEGFIWQEDVIRECWNAVQTPDDVVLTNLVVKMMEQMEGSPEWTAYMDSWESALDPNCGAGQAADLRVALAIGLYDVLTDKSITEQLAADEYVISSSPQDIFKAYRQRARHQHDRILIELVIKLIETMYSSPEWEAYLIASASASAQVAALGLALMVRLALLLSRTEPQPPDLN